MSTSKTTTNLLDRLKQDYPTIRFLEGKSFVWSPLDQSVTYPPAANSDTIAGWSLLHEVAHSILEHTDYHTDLELVGMEAMAWHHAEKLAADYDIHIDPDHIQDCLDTYRDWLHRRSTCPACSTVSVQTSTHTYRCYNCRTVWCVSGSRFCRPYRKVARA